MSSLFYNLQNFNADISSWVTSGVTTMYFMFRVRSARALWPPPFSRALPCALLAPLYRPHALPPPASWYSLPRPTPRPAPHALLSTRQNASAFNQPLNFDTSSVTRMGYMFNVRF